MMRIASTRQSNHIACPPARRCRRSACKRFPGSDRDRGLAGRPRQRIRAGAPSEGSAALSYDETWRVSSECEPINHAPSPRRARCPCANYAARTRARAARTIRPSQACARAGWRRSTRGFVHSPATCGGRHVGEKPARGDQARACDAAPSESFRYSPRTPSRSGCPSEPRAPAPTASQHMYHLRV